MIQAARIVIVQQQQIRLHFLLQLYLKKLTEPMSLLLWVNTFNWPLEQFLTTLLAVIS